MFGHYLHLILLILTDKVSENAWNWSICGHSKCKKLKTKTDSAAATSNLKKPLPFILQWTSNRKNRLDSVHCPGSKNPDSSHIDTAVGIEGALVRRLVLDFLFGPWISVRSLIIKSWWDFDRQTYRTMIWPISVLISFFVSDNQKSNFNFLSRSPISNLDFHFFQIHFKIEFFTKWWRDQEKINQRKSCHRMMGWQLEHYHWEHMQISRPPVALKVPKRQRQCQRELK